MCLSVLSSSVTRLRTMTNLLHDALRNMAAKEPTPIHNLTKEELIRRVGQLEIHVEQLRNVIAKQDGTGRLSPRSWRKLHQRNFDFTRYNTRHVALKLMYLGADYQGYAVQEDTHKTIESELFIALQTAKLIESRQTSNYHRCGRTDKGVSAYSQVISIDLRTNLLSGIGVKVREGGTAVERVGEKEKEIQYVHILNKVLPSDICVLAWCPVDVHFSARFSCLKRTYKYYFPKGNLNLQAMRDAASRLEGEHDYRNFCKMDVNNGVVHFTRNILFTDIRTLDECEAGYQMCELTVTGKAFLWHQIRCIVAILFLIGQGKESPDVVTALLDIEANPCKPQYDMASEIPLVLFDVEFENIDWRYDPEYMLSTLRHLHKMWTKQAVHASMLKTMLDHLGSAASQLDLAGLDECLLSQPDSLVGSISRKHKALLLRQKCDSFEERLKSCTDRKKRRLGHTTENDHT